MIIKGKITTLRAIELEDLDLLKSLINDPTIEKLVGGYSFPVSTYTQIKWFESLKSENNNLRLIVDLKGVGAVGLINLVNICWKNRTAFHGIKLLPEKTSRQGVGTDAVMSLMKYAFEELQLNRLETLIVEYNIISQKLYSEKCGWTLEGKKRKALFNSNKYHDNLMFGILRNEYFDLIQKNKYWD
jgi:RimJ/RimL family protein N-acetyltransferase